MLRILIFNLGLFLLADAFAEDGPEFWSPTTSSSIYTSAGEACQAAVQALPGNYTICSLGYSHDGWSAGCSYHDGDPVCPGGQSSGAVSMLRYAPQYSLYDGNDSEPPMCEIGNPVDPVSGKKLQTEMLADISNDFSIAFDLHYNSSKARKWRHTYERSVKYINSWTNESVIQFEGSQDPLDINGAEADGYQDEPGAPGAFMGEFGVSNVDSQVAPLGPAYTSRKQACELGWNTYKENFNFIGIDESVAEYLEGGVCRITVDGIIKLNLDVYDVIGGLMHSGGGALGDTYAFKHQKLEFRRHDGTVNTFRFNSIKNKWLSTSTPGFFAEIINDTGPITGFRLVTRDDVIEEYAVNGRLLSIKYLNGMVLAMTYDPDSGLLTRVDNGLGEYLDFNYENFGDDNEFIRLDVVAASYGKSWGFRYNADNNNLKYVDLPDTLSRQYHYEDPDDASLLTGITDERGIRYSTWAYQEGRAVSGYNGNNANQFNIVRHGAGSIDVTRTRSSTLHPDIDITQSLVTQFLGGQAVVSGVEGPLCDGCSENYSLWNEFDPYTGNLVYTDENGARTDYFDIDDNGNPATIEESIEPGVKKTTGYIYDSRFGSRVSTVTEVSVASGESKVTTYNHDDYGNVLTLSIDGFDPSGNPIHREHNMKYEGPYHQISEYDGPRDDVQDVYTFTYHEPGPDFPLLKSVQGPESIVLREQIEYTNSGKIESQYLMNGTLFQQYAYYPTTSVCSR